MQKLIVFVIVFILMSITINAHESRLVNEINNIYLDPSNNVLVVEGWGFIMNAQNYYNNDTHSFTLRLKSSSHEITIRGRQRSISQTDTMFYVGRRYCNNQEYFKNSLECNNYYNNVGFSFAVPLDQLRMEEDYKASLIVNAIDASVQKEVEVYFPNKEIIHLKKGHDHYIVDSKLHDVGAKILNSWVIARKKPHKHSKSYESNLSCSTDKTMYFKQNALFKRIYDKRLINNTTFYSLKGVNNHCDGSLSVVTEGNEINPVWISSTFIKHVGESLTIKTRQINKKPELNVGDHIVVYVDEAFDALHNVTAYDKEDGDLTHKVKVISNTYENKVGSYRIIYSVTDSLNETVTAGKSITVIGRNHPPEIVTNDVTLQRHAPYNALDYAKAYDQFKENISNRLRSHSNVDTSILKTQRQCYSVRDAYNMSSYKCMLVHIIDSAVQFRFLQTKRPFYREELPNQWKNNMSILTEEIINEIIYDSFSLNK